MLQITNENIFFSKKKDFVNQHLVVTVSAYILNYI